MRLPAAPFKQEVYVMSTLSVPHSNSESRALQGILCVLIGMLFFVIQDALMKSLLQTHTIWLLMFIRSVVAIAVLVPIILWIGPPHMLSSSLWKLHLIRGGLFAVGFSSFYAAFPFMGLAEATTIFFSAPLITGLLAAVWLKETIGPHRIGALAFGFFGVVVAINPTSEAFTWIAILPLFSAAAYAVGQIIARQIGERESSLTVGLYTLVFSGIIILFMGWMINLLAGNALTDDYRHIRWTISTEWIAVWHILAILGLTGMIGYILLGRAYQVANASLVAPFDYCYLPFATAAGYFLWGEVPPHTTFVGMSMIVGGGLYLGYRELRIMRHTSDQPVVAETIFAPSNPHIAQMPDDENAGVC